jgi:hypothetical protein
MEWRAPTTNERTNGWMDESVCVFGLEPHAGILQILHTMTTTDGRARFVLFVLVPNPFCLVYAFAAHCMRFTYTT